MTNERVARWRNCGCLAAVAMLPLLAIGTCAVLDAHPSDAEMMRELAAGRPQFEQLLAMAQAEPHVTRISYDFIRTDSDGNVDEGKRPAYLSDTRWNQYRRLFRQLKLESGIQKDSDGSVEFFRSSQGIVTSGSGKGLLWSQTAPDPVLPRNSPRSTEQACEPPRGCYSFKAVEPHWFIEYSSN